MYEKIYFPLLKTSNLILFVFPLAKHWVELATNIEVSTGERIMFVAVRTGEPSDGPGLLIIDDVKVFNFMFQLCGDGY